LDVSQAWIGYRWKRYVDKMYVQNVIEFIQPNKQEEIDKLLRGFSVPFKPLANVVSDYVSLAFKRRQVTV
jgi:hypothetical protein